MRNRSIALGGEPSGHIIFMEHSTTGDGILAALQVLQIMHRRQFPLSDLKKTIKLLPKVQINIPITRKVQFEELPEAAKYINDARIELGESGRVLLRYSGTKPVLRLLVEGPD